MACGEFSSAITGTFKAHGFSLRRDARKYIEEEITGVEEKNRELWLQQIVEAVQRQPLNSAVVDLEAVKRAAEECSSDSRIQQGILNVIDAFSIPRYTYNAEQRRFLLDNSHLNLFGNAKDLINIFRERYSIIYQRTIRHELFVAGTGVEQVRAKDIFHLTPLECLIGSTTKLNDVVILGMLTSLKEGKYHLEDPTGNVELNLKDTEYHNGFFAEGCILLAQGWHEDGVLHATAIGFPPIEPAEVTRSFFSDINFFGGSVSSGAKNTEALKEFEQTNVDASFVFISDIWLDDAKVLNKLRQLFSGFAQCPPTCFVLMGNFTSTYYGVNHVKIIKGCFRDLANILGEFPSLASTKFVFVPGQLDPILNQILPRPPLPTFLMEELKRKLPDIVFTTNPCRIQYCTQEMVVFREDVVSKICRNSLNASVGVDVPKNFARTLLAQNHLCPLPLHVSPIYWTSDHAMRLYPIPDVVVCADRHTPFTTAEYGCVVINPSSFSRNNATFMVYIPATRLVEESQVQDV